MHCKMMINSMLSQGSCHPATSPQASSAPLLPPPHLPSPSSTLTLIIPKIGVPDAHTQNKPLHQALASLPPIPPDSATKHVLAHVQVLSYWHTAESTTLSTHTRLCSVASQYPADSDTANLKSHSTPPPTGIMILHPANCSLVSPCLHFLPTQPGPPRASKPTTQHWHPSLLHPGPSVGRSEDFL